MDKKTKGMYDDFVAFLTKRAAVFNYFECANNPAYKKVHDIFNLQGVSVEDLAKHHPYRLISSKFTWANTPQGSCYWNELDIDWRYYLRKVKYYEKK